MDYGRTGTFHADSGSYPSSSGSPHSGERMTGAEMVWRALAENKVNHVFGYPGGAVLPIYDAYKRQQAVRHILVRHEQGAVHAADGYARASGNVGVVLVTSGPGATNTVTGIHTAYQDSIPLVVITGQVPVNLIGTQAFQECNITAITATCTKKNYLVRDIKDLPRILHEAFCLARSGRPGPVLVDIPKNVQTASGLYCRPAEWMTVHRSLCQRACDHPAVGRQKIAKALDLMARAERPVFYTGGGLVNDRPKDVSLPEACRLFRAVAKMTGFPVTSTLMGLGAFPASDPQWLGMPGMHGTYEANMSLCNADLVIAIGARFDDRVTTACNGFAPQAKVIHIDIDPASINKLVSADVGLAGDCSQILNGTIAAMGNRDFRPNHEALREWRGQIAEWRRADSLNYADSADAIKPQKAIQQLHEMTRFSDPLIVTDVGQHQMWVAQYYGFDQPNRLITSGGFGTMGFGLPAALGAQMACPNSLVVCVSGDGSFQMNSQEMSTAVQYGMPVKVLLLNNHSLGMVREWQELFFENNLSESSMETQPDFAMLAQAHGWKGLRCTKPEEFEPALGELLSHKGPALLDCRIKPDENVFPIIAPGSARNDILLAPHLRAT